MAQTVLWSRNRGVQAMTRVVLARRGERPLLVETLAALRASLDERPAGALVTTDEDLEASGLDAASLERLFPEVPILVVCSGKRPLPDPAGPRVRVIPLPFSAADLLDSLSSPGDSPPPIGTVPTAAKAVLPDPTNPPQTPVHPERVEPTRTAHFPDLANPPPERPRDPLPGMQDIQAMVRTEVQALLETTLREWVRRTVREVVPELAESLIREELERLLGQAEETALQGPSAEDPEGPPRR